MDLARRDVCVERPARTRPPEPDALHVDVHAFISRASWRAVRAAILVEDANRQRRHWRRLRPGDAASKCAHGLRELCSGAVLQSLASRPVQQSDDAIDPLEAIVAAMKADECRRLPDRALGARGNRCRNLTSVRRHECGLGFARRRGKRGACRHEDCDGREHDERYVSAGKSTTGNLKGARAELPGCA